MAKAAEANDLWALDIAQLRVLHLLLTRASVTEAADRLGVSQPAVSLRLARFRTLFADPLLVRAGTGLVPTERGRALIQPLSATLDAFERLSTGDPFEPALSRRSLRIAAPNYLGPTLIPDFAARMAAEAPGIALSLETNALGRNHVEALADGDLDLLVANWPVVPDHLMSLALPDDKLVCVVANDHPLAGAAPLDLETWLGVAHISPSRSVDWRYSPVDAQVSRLRRTRTIKVVVSDYTLIPQVVARTRLVFTTGLHFARVAAQMAPVTVIPAPAAFRPVPFRLLWHERSHHDAAHAWTRSVLRDIALGRPGPDCDRPD